MNYWILSVYFVTMMMLIYFLNKSQNKVGKIKKRNKYNEILIYKTAIMQTLKEYDEYKKHHDNLQLGTRLYGKIGLPLFKDNTPLALYYVHFIKDCDYWYKEADILDLGHCELKDYITNHIYCNYYIKGFSYINISCSVDFYISIQYIGYFEERYKKMKDITFDFNDPDYTMIHLLLQLYPIKQGET